VKKLGICQPDKLQKIKVTLIVANGEVLAVQGKTIISLRSGNSTFKVTMLIVHDISQACILGSDSFERESCYILYDAGTFVAKGEEVLVFYQKKAPSDCHVILTEQVELQQGTEVVLRGKLEPAFERNNGTPGILKGLRNDTVEKLVDRFCVARTLMSQKRAVHLTNFAEKAITLKPGKSFIHVYIFDVRASCGRIETSNSP